MDNTTVHVNFFPLKTQFFEFTCYVQKCISDLQRCDSFDFDIKRFKLPIDDNGTNYEEYFVTLEEQPNFLQRTIKSNKNNRLTVWFLFKQLCYNAEKQTINFSCMDKYEKCVDIIIKTTNVGDEMISIIPMCLNNQFGFLIDFHFKKNKEVTTNREVQKLSLSLDSSGRPNKNYYSDKYDKIKNFVDSDLFRSINSLQDKAGITTSFEMSAFKSRRLAAKKYIFGDREPNTSQFKGIEKKGPYQLYSGNPILCFVYRNQDKDLSHTLYYALNGKTYPTFCGMEKIFRFSMNKNSVIGISVKDYTESEIEKLIFSIKSNIIGDRTVIPIILVPWTRDTASEEQSKIYYSLKHHLLKENIPSQFVGIPRVSNYENLKWSVSNIGLQIFTKLGGSPWCMDTETRKCLIIGIGQSHKKNNLGKIEKYYSYSILTDASGLFKNIKVLAENTDEMEYLKGLANQLGVLIQNESKSYDNIAIHTSFRLRNNEILKINSVAKEMSDKLEKEFVVIRFSYDHHYIGFNLMSNPKVPVESTIVNLNQREYLIWFEGLSSSTQTIKTRIGPPVHLTIDFAKSYLSTVIHSYLQDAINLSGANWRGFNAKTTPVSILYAHLLSSFLADFDKYNLERINIEQLFPWFL